MSSYREAVSTQHSVLQYGYNLHVNELLKVRHYRARSTEEVEEEEQYQMAFFYFAWQEHKMRYYGNVIRSFYWKSAVEHDHGV